MSAKTIEAGRIAGAESCIEVLRQAMRSTEDARKSIRVVCNNIFYIRDGVVVEYAPTGRCYTDDSVRPQSRYLTLHKK